ncbi:NTF2-like domain protein [Stagonosporopsis vannaccii]|nr:NTF2-like domain protein [Stagonosporopsis vannaccii]
MEPTPAQRRAVELAHGNLFNVFGNYDPVSRREAIKALYHEDGVLEEPRGVTVKGHDAIDKHIQKIQDRNVDWEFKTVGPVKQVQDLVVVAWTYGPKGKTVLEGSDHIIVNDGKIKVIYGVLGDQADINL